MLVRRTPLWAGTLTLVSLGLVVPAAAADFTVTTQGQFDAAVAAATQPGAADTINVDTPAVSAGTMLSLPGSADSVTINFNGVSGGPATANPAFDVGFGTTDQLSMGAGTTLNFNTDN